MSFTLTFPTRWADFDANRHMRHSSYNDYAAEARVRFFKSHNITIKDFTKNNIGPILFEEHTSFRKEIHMGEDITINLVLSAMSEKGERWKIRHQLFNEAGKLAAVIEVYGAWLDLEKRKLTTPPESFRSMFETMEKTEDFEVIPMRKN